LAWFSGVNWREIVRILTSLFDITVIVYNIALFSEKYQ
jgi:hypothetical protein